MIKILFVCMGNICRSPTAEGVFQDVIQRNSMAEKVKIDSAGTYAYHTGESPDKRAISAAASCGIDISKQTARAVREQDFNDFDIILAMDRDNLDVLKGMAPIDSKAKLKLFLDYGSNKTIKEVPDPYFGGTSGFQNVLDLITDASSGLLKEVRRLV